MFDSHLTEVVNNCLAQIIDARRPGNIPLYEPMTAYPAKIHSLTQWAILRYMCVSNLDDDYHPISARPLQSSLRENVDKTELLQFHKLHFEMHRQNVGHFVSASVYRITSVNGPANSLISCQIHLRWLYCVYSDQVNTDNDSPGCYDTIVDICRDSPSVPITCRPKETLAIMSVIPRNEYVAWHMWSLCTDMSQYVIIPYFYSHR